LQSDAIKVKKGDQLTIKIQIKTSQWGTLTATVTQPLSVITRTYLSTNPQTHTDIDQTSLCLRGTELLSIS